MKKLLVLAFALSLLVGCAKIREVKENVSVCYNDPACFEQAVEKAKKTGFQAGELAGLSGFPWASKVAKPVAGYGMLIFALASLGKKKKESLFNG